MPVTLKVAAHNASAFAEDFIASASSRSPKELLQSSARKASEFAGEVFQSSFATRSATVSNFIPQSNGLVHTILEAYNRHRHLVLRPDDVWLAVLAQFSFYVNAHAEQLRSHFVAHQGKKQLEIRSAGTRYTVDFGELAKRMTDLIEENLLDPELKNWIIPNFSTTAENDVVVASVVMMATMKKYFDYKFSLCCGIPSVTLLGEVGDWRKLKARLAKLSSFGQEHKQLRQWRQLLEPVIDRFIGTFENPAEQVDFWNTVAHYSGGGSGPRYLSGWVTAFCVFSEEGRWQGGNDNPPGEWQTERLVVGGSMYPRIDSMDVPPGWCETPVVLDDNGLCIKSVMVAGSVGFEIMGQGAEGEGEINTVQPGAGWWIFEVDEAAEEAAKRERRRWGGL